MPRPRKHFTPEEKVSLLRRHLLEKAPISTLCEEAGIQPSLFYVWQKQFFENGTAAFQANSRPRPDQREERIAALEAKVRRKDEVLAELMEEHVALKKSLGEL
jgi:transposase-like protein